MVLSADETGRVAEAGVAHLHEDLPPGSLRVVQKVPRMHDAAAEAQQVSHVNGHLEVYLHRGCCGVTLGAHAVVERWLILWRSQWCLLGQTTTKRRCPERAALPSGRLIHASPV